MLKKFLKIVSGLLCIMVFNVAQAALISRTIVNDGSMADWYDPGSIYVPPGDITNNTGQFSNDALDGSGDLDEPLTSTGRDLRKFSYTWDNTNLYLYVERWASSTNVTDWWFYLDTNTNGLMETGEKVFRIKWQGSNQSTVATIWDYTESAAGGDPMVSPGTGLGDGYTMPGSISNETAYYSSSGGASSGTEMESYISWATLGFAGPSNVQFHISSSNGSNLPNNIIDNMDGPAGGEIFPDDLEITKTVSAASVRGDTPISYSVSVYNGSLITFTGVEITDVLPGIVNYVSHSAPAGTTFTDTGDADTDPDLWSIPSIASLETLTLTITITGANVPVQMTATNTATLSASDQTDEVPGNDSDSVDVEVLPRPLIGMVKSASDTTVDPGQAITYTLYLSNSGGEDAESVVINDELGDFTALGINTYGPGVPFDFIEGSPASGLSIGTIIYNGDPLYTPVSGGGGAPAGYDGNIESFEIQMTGSMNNTGGEFEIDFEAIIE